MPFKMIAALCTFLALLATPILGQHSWDLAPPSPCPTVLTYNLSESEPGWWSGVLTLSTDSLLHSLWLDIVLDSKAIKILHRMVEAFTQDLKNFRIEDEDMQIQPDIPISLRFSVQYDTNGEVPGVQEIRLNGEVICNALSAEEQTDSGLKTNINSNMRPVIKPSKLLPVTSPVYPRPDNRSGPRNISNAGDNFSGRQSSVVAVRQRTQCGTPTLRSRWPWVAAIYGPFKNHLGYLCGGTLLSHLHVITTTICVHDESSGKPGNTSGKFNTNEKNLVVHLGKARLSSLLGVQVRLVQKIILSPGYVYTGRAFSGYDVALLVLHEPVTYTDWIRPVCLWPASETDLGSIIGKKGWLVGWRYDDKRAVIDQLIELEMPVVNKETCSKKPKDYVFFDIFSESNNYYCAGDRDDTVLCTSVGIGNGMVFKMGNSWYLRGQVSYFFRKKLMPQLITICDPRGYFIFTDVAKFPWIRDTVSNYL